MMIETTHIDSNISHLSQSYENTELDTHEREEKLYAKYLILQNSKEKQKMI